MSRYKQAYSLYKRGKYWYYRTYSPDGVRTTAKTTGCTSRKAAMEYCDRLQLAGFLYYNSITFEAFAADFYADDGLYFKDRVEPVSYSTKINYQKQMRNIIMPYFKDKELSQIDYICLKTFRAKLITDGFSAMTIQQVMSILKHIIDYAYKSRRIRENPYNFLESISMPENERDAYTIAEVKFIYNKINKEFKNTVLFLALTGLRISECMGMQKNEIIQADGFEYIDLKLQYIHKEYAKLKGKRSRPVPIIPEIKNMIDIAPERLSAFYRAINELKNEIEANTSSERNLAAFHSLRHFFITNSKAANVNEAKVEFIAGHTLKKIRKVYTNFKAEDLTDILAWQKSTLDYLLK